MRTHTLPEVLLVFEVLLDSLLLRRLVNQMPLIEGVLDNRVGQLFKQQGIGSISTPKV